MSDASPSSSPAPGEPGRSHRPLRPIRLVAVALIGLAAVVVAIAWAAALDNPVGAGARDPQANMPEVIGNPGSDTTDTDTARQPSLPPLALMRNRQLPARLRSLRGPALLSGCRARATNARSADAYVDLAYVVQSLGQPALAAAAYRKALAHEPGNLEARIGLLLVPAAGGDSTALQRADRALAALERRFPNEQLPAFNRAWLALYRSDAPTARAGFERALALDANTPLGRIAQRLLSAAAASAPGTGMAPTP